MTMRTRAGTSHNLSPILIVAAVSTIVLGTIGYRQYMPQLGLSDWVYSAIRLVLLDFQRNASDAQPPAILNVARYLGMLTFAGTLFVALKVVFDRQLQQRRERRMTDHVVVVGSSSIAVELADSLATGPSRAEQPSVPSSTNSAPVALLGEVDTEKAERLRAAGVLVVDEGITKRRAEVLRGSTLVYITGADDIEAAETASDLLRTIETQNPDSACSIRIVLQDPDYMSLFRTNQITAGTNEPGLNDTTGLDTTPRITIDICLLPDRIARKIVSNTPPRHTGDPTGATIVFGQGNIANAIATQAAVTVSVPGDPLPLTCIGPNAHEWGHSVNELSRGAAAVDTDSLSSWTIDIAVERVSRLCEQSTHSTIYVAGFDDLATATLAGAFATEIRNSKVVAVVSRDVNWNRLLDLSNTELTVESIDKLARDPAVIADGPVEVLARELFLDQRRWPASYRSALGENTGDDQKEWETLSDSRKDLYRGAAQQIPLALAAANLRTSPHAGDIVLTPKELTTLADYLFSWIQSTGRTGGPESFETDEGDPLSGEDEKYRFLEFASRLPYFFALTGLGIRRIESTKATLTPRTVELLAETTHMNYVAEAKDQGRAINPDVDLPWIELAEPMRESNRAQVRDIPVKLAFISRSFQQAGSEELDSSWLTADNIEQLAICEHRRWVHQKVLRGWKFGQVRDNARLIHNDLVPWSALSHDERQKDVEPIKQIPSLLAAAGLATRPMP